MRYAGLQRGGLDGRTIKKPQVNQHIDMRSPSKNKKSPTLTPVPSAGLNFSRGHVVPDNSIVT